MKYVELDAVLAVATDWCPDDDGSVAKTGDIREMLDELETIPAADVRPVVHGHWVYEEPNGANSFKGAYWCDQCHQPESYRKNFCPNCGTDMREVT